MVEERSLSDAELDAALSEAFAVDPSPEFIARLRRRVADEPSTDRRLRLFALAAAVCAIATVFVVIMSKRTPVVEPGVVRTATTDARTHPALPDASAVPVVSDRPAARARRASTRELRAKPVERRTLPDAPAVLIPVAEQQALRKLFERPPTAVLRFAQEVDAMDVAGITIPALNIDPLSPQIEDGGHQ
jgi:hypothetical protein